jgi:peptide/nickel transport system ATP-binding protein
MLGGGWGCREDHGMNDIRNDVADGGVTVAGLSKTFVSGGGLFGGPVQRVRAVDDVSLVVEPQGSLGLVGESGCGKSTVARCILRLIEPEAGDIRCLGIDVANARGKDLALLRRRMQIVFQDPYSSLNPRRTIRQTLAEPLIVHGICSRSEASERVNRMLSEVGLSADVLDRYPHEFSGGQRQRVGIARALVLEPSFVVADEPVSALDVSVQAQVLRLLTDLRDRRQLGFLFVSHDLGVVRHFCTNVAVMYLGRIVEHGGIEDVFREPLHPYTRLLLDSSPVPDPAARHQLPDVSGEVPSASNPPSGCAFHPRCPHAQSRCKEARPAPARVSSTRMVACHLHG